MGRKRTILNRLHPHGMLKTYIEKGQKAYKGFTRAELLDVAEEEGIKAKGRPQILKALAKLDEARFKDDWQKKFKWPFDDCYDKAKLLEHIRNHKADERENA